MLNADGLKGNNVQRDLKFREKRGAKAEGDGFSVYFTLLYFLSQQHVVFCSTMISCKAALLVFSFPSEYPESMPSINLQSIDR